VWGGLPSCSADKAAFASQKGESLGSPPPHWIELATDENTLLALEPTNRIVPTTMTRITASITAYSAMSWPSSSRHTFKNKSNVLHLFRESARHELLVTARRLEDSRMSRS